MVLSVFTYNSVKLPNFIKKKTAKKRAFMVLSIFYVKFGKNTQYQSSVPALYKSCYLNFFCSLQQ